MTVAAILPRVSYMEDGTTLSFAAPFRYLDPTDLVLTRVLASGTLQPLTYGSDYSATAGTTDAGGTVTLIATVAGAVLRVRRATAQDQPDQYNTNDSFPAPTLERGLDRPIMLVQEQAVDALDATARALMVADGESVSPMAPGGRVAGQFLAFDANKNPISASGTGADAGLRTDLATPAVGGHLVSTTQGQDVQSALDQVTGVNVTTPLSRIFAAQIAIGAGRQAAGGGGTVTSSALNGIVSISGAGAVLRDVSLVAAAPAAGASVLGVYASNLSNSQWLNVSVDLTAASAGSQLLAYALAGNVTNHMAIGLRANGPGYGFLANNMLVDTTAMDGHVLIGFNLTSGQADAIEYNTPGPALKHAVTWGGILDAGRSGAGAVSGFALGIAHNQGWVAGGFVVRWSRTAGVHIEDGSSFGVLSSISLRGCQLDGIWGSIYGNNQASATPIVISTFAAEGPGNTVANSNGINLIYNAFGYTTLWPITGGYLANFSVGLNLDGFGVHPVTNVVVDNCTVVYATAGGRQHGTVFSRGATVLARFNASVGGRAGKFVQADIAPQKIIDRPNSPVQPGATVDGFAFPALSMPLSGGFAIPNGAGAIKLFPQPNYMMRGRLRVTLDDASGDGFFWEGNIVCLDGATVGVEGGNYLGLKGNVVPATYTVASFTATRTPNYNILNVTAVASGTLAPGQTLVGYSTSYTGAKIVRQLSSTATGGAFGSTGAYLVDATCDGTGAAPMTATSPFAIAAGVVSMAITNGTGQAQTVTICNVEFDGTYNG